MDNPSDSPDNPAKEGDMMSEVYIIKIGFGIVSNKPQFHEHNEYLIERAYDCLKRAQGVNVYNSVTVHNSIHECVYSGKEFRQRYEAGQRKFIKSNHPTFRRWRPKKGEKYVDDRYYVRNTLLR